MPRPASRFGARRGAHGKASLLKPMQFLLKPPAPLQHQPPVPLKPHPAAPLEIASSLGVRPSDWLYLGDTNTDMRTATAAGMFPVGVLWGFRERAELIESGARELLAHPRELLRLL